MLEARADLNQLRQASHYQQVEDPPQLVEATVPGLQGPQPCWLPEYLFRIQF